MITKLNLQSPWDEVKEKLKEANTDLTDEDLEYDEVDASKLLETLSHKMQKSKEHVQGWIESVAFTKGTSS